MIRRMLITLVIFAVPALVILLFSYDVLVVDFDSFMETQPSIKYEEGPRLLPPDEAVPVERPSYLVQNEEIQNPVRADEISLQRGQILFDFNCAVCHGGSGQGDGPVSQFWDKDARLPANLMSERVAKYADSAIYTFITSGFGVMPPLRENLTERERWDVINYLRDLQARSSQ